MCNEIEREKIKDTVEIIDTAFSGDDGIDYVRDGIGSGSKREEFFVIVFLVILFCGWMTALFAHLGAF